MSISSFPERFNGAPTATFDGLEVPVAVGFRARLLGLAGLDREAAGPGLLIPRCSAVHTFGMRFPLDVHFLDGDGAVASSRLELGRRRLVAHRGAAAVLELPAATTGESGGADAMTTGEMRNLRW